MSMGILRNIFSSFFTLGYLWKQGGRYKSWKRRWFILNDNCLYYFEFTTDKEPRGIIPLDNIMVSICCIHIYHNNDYDDDDGNIKCSRQCWLLTSNFVLTIYRMGWLSLVRCLCWKYIYSADHYRAQTCTCVCLWTQ